VTSIEREGSIIHPADETTIRPNDVVTVLPKDASAEEHLTAFVVAPEEAAESSAS